MDKADVLVTIIDDDASVRRGLRRAIEAIGARVQVFASGEEYFAQKPSMKPDFLLVDVHLPGAGGPDLVASLRAQHPSACIVMITGRETPGSRAACITAGADMYVIKPIPQSILVDILRGPPPAGEHKTMVQLP
jgi:FixJ family two-component response regulator